MHDDRLTQAQQAKVIAAIQERGASNSCSSCRHTQFSLLETLVRFSLADNTELVSVAVLCKRCGNTQLHNVIALGVDEMLGVSRARTELSIARDLGIIGGSGE
jgi:hypothetical protein